MRTVACALSLTSLIACSAGAPAPELPDAGPPQADADATPSPVASGCIDNVTAGDHVYTCGDLQVDATIPTACLAPGCGLILQLHGDTGNGLLMDANTNLRELGRQNGYVVIAPTGPPFGFGY